MYADQRLCQHCLDLCIGSKSDHGGPVTKAHPAYKSLKTLAESGKTCSLCMFFYEEDVNILGTWTDVEQGSAVFRGLLEEAIPSLSVYNSVVSSSIAWHGQDGRVLDPNASYQILYDGPEVERLRWLGMEALTQEVPRSPTHSTSLSKMRDWLATCNETHSLCREHQVSGFTPSRLLDVGTEAVPQLRLVVSQGNSKQRYMTLSHCWGKTRPFVLNSSNYEACQKHLEESSTPQTFQDAFRLARLLDIRFVWIDSLCIRQDDRHDWEAQSVQMGQIYKHAFVTIAASNSPSDADGFLHPRRPSAIKCGSHIVEGTERTFYVSEKCGYMRNSNDGHRMLQLEPLSRRGWVVQERALPTRSISFGSRQSFWRCRETIAPEDGRVLHPSLSRYRQGSNLSAWDIIVAEFSPCRLSVPSDKLPAMSGIASEFARKTDDVYLAGHWLRSLPRSLLWFRFPKSEKLARASSYRAPSWSWASQDGHIRFHGESSPGSPMAHLKPIAKLVNYNIDLVSQVNPYGEITSGSLTISAQVCKVTLDGERLELDPKYHDGVLSIHPSPYSTPGEHFDDPQDQYLYPMYFAIIVGTNPCEGLLLVRCEDGSDCYRRVGMTSVWGYFAKEFQEEVKFQDITLV